MTGPSNGLAGKAAQADLRWLLRLRASVLAVGVAVALVGREILHLELPTQALSAVAAVGFLSIIAARGVLSRPPSWLAPALLLLDGLLLTVALALSGGVENPFVLGYLSQIALAGALFGRRGTAAATAGALGAMGLLVLVATPIRLDHGVHEARAHAHHHAHSHTTATTPEEHLHRHLQGSWLGFASAALLVGYLLDRALRQRDETIQHLKEDNRRQQQLAELGAMAAQAAHELGTPLSTIGVAARELSQGLAGESLEEEAKTIERQVDRCRAVLEELGRQARGEAEVGRVVPVAGLVASACESFVGSKGPALEVDVSPLSLTVFGPERAMVHVVRGLIANARRASPVGGIVTVRGRASDDRVCIEVLDEGEGMSPAMRAQAGHEPVATKEGGLGLGLFLSRAVIDRVGGHLELATGTQGTVARLRLPTGDPT